MGLVSPMERAAAVGVGRCGGGGASVWLAVERAARLQGWSSWLGRLLRDLGAAPRSRSGF
jgi:hypothetical protein